MKKSLSILFVLFFLPANLFAADTLEKLLKKWTYHHVIGCGKAYLTYVSDDIVDAWMDEENSKEMLDRIGKLKQTIKDEKIRLYLLKVIKMNRSDFHIDFSDFEKRIYMQITEADDNKYFPAAISRNLSGELRHPQTYYGFVAFKSVEDDYSFQTITLEYRWFRQDSKGSIKEDVKDKLQFSFLPNGVPRDHQKSAYSTSDAIGILRAAFFIVRMVARIPI